MTDQNVVAVGSFKYDRRNDGLILLENRPRRINGPIIGVPFLNSGELSVKGEVMAQRAGTLDANYGQEDAEWLLENQGMILAELRNYLVFPATKWRHPDGDRYVPYLYFYGRQWRLSFIWLDFDFYGVDRVVRPRNSLIPTLF